ncbi:hypothetical protein J6590_077480 [Homalodisca vitripennis]|nr:hypothetical protein J6590_077480 [Homalodisca vitripennis]
MKLLMSHYTYVRRCKSPVVNTHTGQKAKYINHCTTASNLVPLHWKKTGQELINKHPCPDFCGRPKPIP